MTRLYYLAHPYTNPSPEENVAACIKIANRLIDAGHVVYAPIVMTHWLDKAKTREPDFWYTFDFTMVRKCDALVLAGNWKASKGCMLEKGWFEGMGRPVYEVKTFTDGHVELWAIEQGEMKAS